MIGALREWVYRRRLVKPVELPAFTVSVGNLSVGGTGKSALVMHLAEWAVAARIGCAVLSRGYKRKSSGVRVVAPGALLPPAEEIGDEPWMIRRRVPGAGLLVHANRAARARRHWAELGAPGLVLLDDAFQHWPCARNLDILMIDATESLDQRILPFGRLRERVEAARRADYVVLTRARAVDPARLDLLESRIREGSRPRSQPTWKRATLPELHFLRADYLPSGFLDAATGAPVEPPAGREALLVSGVAKPDHLRSVVRQAGVQVVEEIYFPDHHRLSSGDIRQIRRSLAGLRNGLVVVTEKDWGRWRELFAGGVPGLVFCVRFDFFGEGEGLDGLLRRVAEGVRCFTSP